MSGGKPKYTIFFTIVVILINFLHKRHMDFTHKIVEKQTLDIIDHG
jgi:hypothetical protein